MNKKYTINNIEVTAEQIKDIIKNNPELVEDKKVNGRYFFPKKGEIYYAIQHNGLTCTHDNFEEEYDQRVTELGVYRTKEEAELARDKQKAIVACWKWAEENAPFEPDWNNGDQKKYYPRYEFFTQNFNFTYFVYTVQCGFTLPYFKSKEDCGNFILANEANLKLLSTK